MDEKQANQLINKLVKRGYTAKLYKDYSGKFMFGDKTFGVQTETVIDGINFRRDCLGLNYIYY